MKSPIILTVIFLSLSIHQKTCIRRTDDYTLDNGSTRTGGQTHFRIGPYSLVKLLPSLDTVAPCA